MLPTWYCASFLAQVKNEYVSDALNNAEDGIGVNH
jgi:hypothetical protein